MKRNIIYVIFMATFLAVICLQLKFIYDLQVETDVFSGFSFVVPGNLSYMAVGLMLALEGILAEKAGQRIRAVSRMIVVLVLLAEIFKLPLSGVPSALNEWSYILAAPSVAAAFLLVRFVADVIRQYRNKM